MTTNEIVNKVLEILDENVPFQQVDTTLRTNLLPFVNDCVPDFLLQVPSYLLSSLVESFTASPTMIPYNGAYIILPDDFLLFTSFRHSSWKRTVHEAVAPDSLERRRQESKFTCGCISRPVVCINNSKGKKILEYWGRGIKDDFTCEIIKKTTDAAKIPNDLIGIYKYYVAHCFYLSTDTLESSKKMYDKFLELLTLRINNGNISV